MPRLVEIHPHARQRCRERGATIAEVIHTVLGGRSKPAKFGRILFSRTFVYDRIWMGRKYRQKKLDVIAVRRSDGSWLAVTVIVKFF